MQISKAEFAGTGENDELATTEMVQLQEVAHRVS
jgi:hypothetical protein